ncbi:MAG: hypothetical protein HY727_16190 [Candidatus Rokubacteria bacterium]|nr:hypothetical protein [Candidatus Rokubacteria bacterium]
MSIRLPFTSRPVRAAAALAWLAVLAAGAAQASAQGNFRITYNVDRTGPTHVQLIGEVFNDASIDVLDVYVSAEALDASGKRLAQGITWVGPIRARSNASFAARVPAVRGTTGFKVTVNSFQYGLGRGESP